jgi:CRISPR/Cas system-associated exonuclease Cas4 (RecB family)
MVGWIGENGIKIDELCVIFNKSLFRIQNPNFKDSEIIKYISSNPDVFHTTKDIVYLTRLGKLCFRTLLTKETINDLKIWLKKPTVKKFMKIVSDSQELKDILNNRISPSDVYTIFSKWLKDSAINWTGTDFSMGEGDIEQIKRYFKLVAFALKSISEEYDINIKKKLWVLGLPNCIELGLDPQKYGELAIFYGTGRISKLNIKNLYDSRTRKLNEIQDKSIEDIQNILSSHSFKQAILIKNKSLQILEDDKYLSAGEIADFVHCPLSFLLKQYKLTFEPPEYIKNATKRGTIIHKLIKQFNLTPASVDDSISSMDDLIKKNNIVDEFIIKCCKNYSKYISNISEKPTKSELKVASDDLRLNGIIDGIIERDDKSIVLEYKSGTSDERKEMDKVQAASYSLIYKDISKIACEARIIYLSNLNEEIISLEEEHSASEAIALAHKLFIVQPDSIEGLADLCICKTNEHVCICNYFFKAI